MNAITVLAVVFAAFLKPCNAPAEKLRPVTVENFVRAESDDMIRANIKFFNKDTGLK